MLEAEAVADNALHRMQQASERFAVSTEHTMIANAPRVRGCGGGIQ